MRLLALCAALALGLLPAGPTAAQSSDACHQFKWPVDRELTSFAADLPPIRSGAAAPGLVTGIDLQMQPQEEITYMVPPARKPKSAPAFGAEITGTVLKAGTYQVTLSADAWVDVAQGGVTLRSTDFSGKMGCSTVRKSVKFSLVPGPMTLAVSDSPVNRMKVELLPAE